MLSAKEQGKSTQHEKKLNAQAKVRLDDGKGRWYGELVDALNVKNHDRQGRDRSQSMNAAQTIAVFWDFSRYFHEVDRLFFVEFGAFPQGIHFR